MTLGTSMLTRRRGRARSGIVAVSLALCATALVASACGLSYDTAPQEVPGQLPSQLDKPSATAPTTTSRSSCSNGNARCNVGFFYYIQHSVLIDFPQSIAEPVTVAEVLRTLESGPSGVDAGAKGGVVTSDIPIGSNLQAGAIVKGVAHIGLTAANIAPNTPQWALELGQIVETVTVSVHGVSAVQFYLNGTPVTVVNGSGQEVTGTVNKASYCVAVAGGCQAPPPTTRAKPSDKTS